MMTEMAEKLAPWERALKAASQMSAPEARRVTRLICESGMMNVPHGTPEPTEGEKHYSKREKFIQRTKSEVDRVCDYARHETLRKIEAHFRDTSPVSSAEGDPTSPDTGSLAARLTFKKSRFAQELLAALREEGLAALTVAGQQLFDELGRDDPWTMPGDDSTAFLDARANLLANVPDEVHAEIMDSIQQGLDAGETRRQLMARIASKWDEIGTGRAETIANTETAAAFNFARDKAMREAGVTHKRWLHSMSPLIKEPRPTHLEADGQIRPIDKPFNIGGVKMMMPGDESAPADEVINCHCVAIPVEKP